VENITDEEKTTPYSSPLHAGGLIAIRRDYFLRQHTYVTRRFFKVVILDQFPMFLWPKILLLYFKLYTVKKGYLSIFPSPAGMPLTKLSLAGNNLIIHGQEEFD
jgi:hypothetical protein